MEFNTVHLEEKSKTFDAFYKDEMGVVNTSYNISVQDPNVDNPDKDKRKGIHKNRFTMIVPSAAIGASSTVIEFPKNTAELEFENQANPRYNLFLKEDYKQTKIPSRIKNEDDVEVPFYDKHSVGMFFSDSIINAVAKGNVITINVTILYAVESEMNRHGLRSFFEKSTAFQAIILVPGAEPPADPGRWGIAISDKQIKDLIKWRFQKDVSYEVKVLAAFSTGACGLHQTLLHNLIEIDKVERVIYFDCLYVMQCNGTPAAPAIQKLKANAPKAKIIIYKTSPDGNTFIDNPAKVLNARLTVPTKHPLLFDSRGFIGNLFDDPAFISLICFRSLEVAVIDKIVTIPKNLEKAFKDMGDALKSIPRGSFISNKIAFNYIHGGGMIQPPAGKTFFEDWAKSNAKMLIAFPRGSVLKKNTVRYILWRNAVPGWLGNSIGDEISDGAEKHDLVIPEFGWEFLT